MDTFHKEVAKNKRNKNHYFYGYELGRRHSKLGNKHETNTAFCSGLNKIQNKKSSELTPREKKACQPLLKKNHPKWAIGDIVFDSSESEDDNTPFIDWLCQYLAWLTYSTMS